jgi:hypothetical protein
MAVVFAFDSTDVLDVWECGLEMTNPLGETIGVAGAEGFNDPRQVGTVGFEAADLARRASLADDGTVKDEFLDAVGKELLEPSGSGEFGFVFREVAEGGFSGAEFECGGPAFAGLAVDFGIEIIVAAGDFVNHGTGVARVFGCLDGIGRLGRVGKEVGLAKWEFGLVASFQKDFFPEDCGFALGVVTDGDFVTDGIKLRFSEFRPNFRFDRRFQGQLDWRFMALPDEVTKIFCSLVDSGIESVADELAEKCDHVKECGFAAGIGADEDMEIGNRLGNIAQAAEVEALDSREHMGSIPKLS